MNGATSEANAACPCGTVVFPWVICNPDSLSTIAYRSGDYLAFRHRLLQALPGETQLPAWRPGAQGDLAVQMMEWWAYLADILTFYNERLANESFLTTAVLPESVNHLVQVLGYRPRPALGASGTLAAILAKNARLPLTLPAGLQIQSKPWPGQQPQVFELDQQTTVTAPDVIVANVVPSRQPLLGSNFVWLAGKVTGIKAGDRYLLINTTALTAGTIIASAWITVSKTSAVTDPLGAPVTQVEFSTSVPAALNAATATNCVLLRAGQSAPLWGYPVASSVLTASSVDLASTARQITAGSLVLLDVNESGQTPTPITVTSYSEVVWWVDNSGNTQQTIGSPPASPAPIAFPHAHMSFTAPAGSSIDSATPATVTARWGWTPVGQLVPVLSAADYNYTNGGTALVPAPGSAAFPTTPASVLAEEAGSIGIMGTIKPAAMLAGAVSLTPDAHTPLPGTGLASPIEVFFNQMPVTRGKTVLSEVIGSGNPVVAGQDFTLQQSPVTYFLDPASISGDGFSSTVRVRVNGSLWKEVRSFFNMAGNAPVFVLREDDQEQTHVMFGDGVNGALLPTGANNVVATYRYGAGEASPPAETLTVVLTPQPGLKGVRNPLQPTGGAEADPPAKLRMLAPASVLTFDRAVSIDDYATLAATAPGVTKVSADLVFDTAAQRPMVTLWIAGDSGARQAVEKTLAGVAMPNQGFNLKLAKPSEVTLSLYYVLDPTMDDATVLAGLTAALVDPDQGLFGINVIGINQSVYDSQIEAACLRIPGVLAIHQLQLSIQDPPRLRFGFRLPKKREPSQLAKCTGHRHDPGAGYYFLLPNDPTHLNLMMEPAS
jgi:predicted phage baseplate assembly protein